MTPDTANKLVAFFALGGIALALFTSKDAATRYRKVWGVTILSMGGGALADFAPSLVGPFFALIIVSYLAVNVKTVSGVVSGIKTQAGVKK